MADTPNPPAESTTEQKSDYNKASHLRMIQGVINRMAGNSFRLKQWAVGIATGLLALSSGSDSPALVVALNFIPVLLFWILDAYFLYQERLFRDVYQQAVEFEDGHGTYAINPSPFIRSNMSEEDQEAEKGRTWGEAFWSKTLVMLYGVLILCMSIVLIYYVWGPSYLGPDIPSF